MPWINKEMCTGCELCINECTVGAISIVKDTAFINDDECIRCGVCHDVCPSEAIRHDGELIPKEVKANLAYAKKLLNHEYYNGDKAKQKQLIERLHRFFSKNKKIAEKTVEQLDSLL